MKRAGSRIISRPFAMRRQILPIPVALIDEPPMPLIVLGGIGLSSKKSEALEKYELSLWSRG